MQSPNAGNDASKAEQIEEQERIEEEESSSISIPKRTTLIDSNLTDKKIKIKELSSTKQSKYNT